MEQVEKWEIIQSTSCGNFLVSNYGRIFNVKTKTFVSPYIHNSRCGKYLRVNLGKRKFMVHVLVAKAFISKEMVQQTQVDHIDRNTLNCNVSNLRWVTPSDNIYFFHKSRTVRFGEQTFHGKNS